MTVHKVAPPAAAAWNEIDARTQFATGKAAMAFAGSWQQAAMLEADPELDKVWGTFPIPGPNGKCVARFRGRLGRRDLEDSKAKDAGLGLHDGAARQAEQQEVRRQPEVLPGLLRPDRQRLRDDKVMAAFATSMQNTKLTPMTPKWVEVSRTKTVTQAMNSSIMKGQKTVDQATADAAAEMESILNAK